MEEEAVEAEAEEEEKERKRGNGEMDARELHANMGQVNEIHVQFGTDAACKARRKA